ncbi:1-aminocyclopropane-1-carboxylate deaminase/D-cysteine desulfhydrase [Flavobacterium silvaticum]|uniref:1-aminocyclopropane-1-carboxylate deaminase/D-cysteine desulfhydrase n=1 Tax=Flavobacterium silvaticum TaxID=1852020 RepID=A0A972FJ49_9FLAO|nr:pyridoxal-phosphate dependent enzyme [Flavobacterium silvaticum]NMH26718.1 1-aminocyclopropane-1-carboxylate deaminase/D-cysteine desulfhydrase [Flavobacterium silvaticum]
MSSVFNQKILLPNCSADVWLKREDLIDPEIPGNKFRKLKYNIDFAIANGFDTLLTFGGAFSNHIDAVAYAGKRFGLKTIGIIRGDELASKPLNPTLSRAVRNGMRLHFINREEYRKKNEESFINHLNTSFGKFYLIPEGGTNELAVRGCEEILTDADFEFDYICCAVGTGGTLAGLSRSLGERQKLLGFSSLKGDFLKSEVEQWTMRSNFDIITDFHFGGYAKVDSVLVAFIKHFEAQNKVTIDPVYTGKMLFGIDKMSESGFFKSSDRVLAIHTGGLQGIEGMKQKMSSIDIESNE